MTSATASSSPSPSSTSSSKTPAADGHPDIVGVEVHDGIAVLTFDVPGEKQNTLSERSSRALQAAFARVESDDAIKGCVLIMDNGSGCCPVALGEMVLSETAVAFADWFREAVGKVAERLKAEGE